MENLNKKSFKFEDLSAEAKTNVLNEYFNYMNDYDDYDDSDDLRQLKEDLEVLGFYNIEFDWVEDAYFINKAYINFEELSKNEPPPYFFKIYNDLENFIKKYKRATALITSFYLDGRYIDPYYVLYNSDKSGYSTSIYLNNLLRNHINCFNSILDEMNININDYINDSYRNACSVENISNICAINEYFFDYKGFLICEREVNDV